LCQSIIDEVQTTLNPNQIAQFLLTIDRDGYSHLKKNIYPSNYWEKLCSYDEEMNSKMRLEEIKTLI